MLLAVAVAIAEEPAVRAAAEDAELVIGGYVEAYWQWNFNNPDNYVTNYRGFDNRHNIFSLQNVVLDVQGIAGRTSTHIALQVGSTSATYYLAEPVWRGTAGANASGPALWQNLQQANLGWTAPIGREPKFEAGLFLSPIGPESFAIKDQWNWSRSNLFFGLPFYHAGLRVSLPVSDHLTVSAHAYNGWNNVTDTNLQLSPAAQLYYDVPGKVTFDLMYFGGVERPAGAPEGAPWRHLLDSYVIVALSDVVSCMAQVDAGVEPNRFGASGWAAGAAYLRLQPGRSVYLAARGDVFREWIARDDTGAASPIFWGGSAWVASGTGTLDLRPADTLSIRLEGRYDASEAPLYFQGEVASDSGGEFIPDARQQATVTVGATAWF